MSPQNARAIRAENRVLLIASIARGRRWLNELIADPTANVAADLSGQWIDLVHGRRPPRGVVLDMDSSVSPTHGEQEMSVWNGHYDLHLLSPAVRV